MTTDDEERFPAIPITTARRFPREEVLRETMLYLASREDRATLVRTADMLFSDILDNRTDAGEPGLRRALCAASQDVRNLQGYFDETAEVMACLEDKARSGRTLVAVARSCGRELGRIADWLDGELGLSPAPKKGGAAIDPAED